MLLNEYEQIVALTKEWEGERFTDGRPKVSDEKIEILKTLTQEEIWHPLYFSGYRFQFQGNMRALHEDKKLYGRAVTCCFMPQRPDVRRLAFDTARGKGWKGDCNQWVIDSLCEGDVVVCDLYDKIFKGTFVGGNLTTAIHARTKTGGAVVWGGVRDIEQMQKIDAQVYFRGVDPTPIRDCQITDFNGPCRIGEALCLPGDIVVGTKNGVLFVPSHMVDFVIENAYKMQVRDLYGATVNGGKDTAGLGTTSSVLSTNFALSAYFQMYGAYPNKWVMRDGKLMNGIVMDEMLDALNGLKTLYDNGAIAPDFATWNSDQFVERVASSQVGAAFGTYYIPAWPLNESKNMTPESDWAEINLANLDGKSNPAINQVSIQHFNVVTKDAPENAEEALIKLLNLSLVANSNSTSDKAVFEGKDLAKNGASIFYLPVYMYYATPWHDYRERIWNAYETKDDSGLITDVEREWYGYMCDWMEDGNEAENLATAWGMYASRLTEDMGIGVGLAIQESGTGEQSYFYGPATATEQRASSTLTDMAVSFIIEYIMGQKTEADWEGFKQSWNKMGGEAWTNEVNEQYASITQ